MNKEIFLISQELHSLDKPDPNIEKAWIKEAEDRFASYEQGKLKTIPFETVIKNIKRK